MGRDWLSRGWKDDLICLLDFANAARLAYWFRVRTVLETFEMSLEASESQPVVLIDQRLESTLENVDQSEERIVALAQEVGFEEEETYRLGYAVREAMVNAVVHGNRYSANKLVHFRVSRLDRKLEIMIEDQGSGFAPDLQSDPLLQENLLNQSGRGLALIRAFTDQLVVEPAEPSGTRVILRKFLQPASG